MAREMNSPSPYLNHTYNNNNLQDPISDQIHIEKCVSEDDDGEELKAFIPNWFYKYEHYVKR